jgi:hypothetical protein
VTVHFFKELSPQCDDLRTIDRRTNEHGRCRSENCVSKASPQIRNGDLGVNSEEGVNSVIHSSGTNWKNDVELTEPRELIFYAVNQLNCGILYIAAAREQESTHAVRPYVRASSCSRNLLGAPFRHRRLGSRALGRAGCHSLHPVSIQSHPLSKARQAQ